MVFTKIAGHRTGYFVTIFLFSIFLFGSSNVHAATLDLSPSAGDLTVGNILGVSVLVDTKGSSINNSDAVINFPASLLEVISISKSGSIFTLWVEEPAFSNAAGTITFNGGLPTPGFNGSAGRLVSIAFRVKAPGTASVFFSAGSVRANDGLGTDVLTSMGTASFALAAPLPAVEPPVEAEAVVPERSETPETTRPKEPEVEVPTEPEIIPVESQVVVFEENIYDKTVNKAVSAFSGISLLNVVLFALVAVLIALLALLLYWRKLLVHLRSRVGKDAHGVEKSLYRSFDAIRGDIAACVDLLEGAKARRGLSEEEREVINLLRQHLRDTEKLLNRDMHILRDQVEK